ncbi:unnamed protein product, partial [marine sediment metagenome]
EQHCEAQIGTVGFKLAGIHNRTSQQIVKLPIAMLWPGLT